MEEDEHMPTSPLAANLRRCYAMRPDRGRSNAPMAGQDLFGMYLRQLARVEPAPAAGEAMAALPSDTRLRALEKYRSA